MVRALRIAASRPRNFRARWPVIGMYRSVVTVSLDRRQHVYPGADPALPI
jgi:hypothetical protein